MAAVPVLMAIYTNDAVEVRYSDGSRLELSPCGSAMKHHARPDHNLHPISGSKSIQQRTRFVTSEFSNKVLHAVDFRNRFAEMPYVCEELLHKDEVMSLYADILQSAWPKDCVEANVERLSDGGVRIFSIDEYASLVLSPHRQEFTVCYLSKLSPPKTNKLSSKLSSSYNNSNNNSNNSLERENETHSRNHLDNNKSFTDDEKLHVSPSLVTEDARYVGRGLVTAGVSPSLVTEDARCVSQDLVTVGVSQSLVSADARGAGQGLVSADVRCAACRVSTPTDELEDKFYSDVEITPYGKTAVFKSRNLDDIPVHDLSSISKTSSEGFCTTIDTDATLNQENRSTDNPEHTCGLSANSVKEDSIGQNISTGSERKEKSWDSNHGNALTDSMGNKDGSCSESDRSDVKCRHQYSWVTRHFSCNECPLSWRHPLKLATDAVADKTQTGNDERCGTPDIVPTFKPGQPKVPVHIDKKKCVLTSLPRALPLTCPFQHRHKWAVLDDSDTLQAGILKVILMDGAVYRIIHMTAVKVIEVYPGDGSVFVSHGSGHYFSHMKYVDGEVTDKTFSIKSLPPQLPGAVYSIERLLKRANRLLTQAIQSDKISSVAVDPCWKYKEVKIVEPLPVETLEECHIPGWGRFTAYTNGRVRIMFDDRTAMDLVSDFSKRIEECVCHSESQAEHLETCEATTHKTLMTVTGLDTEFDRDTCRILLPSGKYILVDLHKPGIYHKYVSQALEWVSWVNSSPIERQKFYDQLKQPEYIHLSAEAELKKISCFNYIADNTGPTKPDLYQENNSTSHLHGLQPFIHSQNRHIDNSTYIGPIQTSLTYDKGNMLQQMRPLVPGNKRDLEMFQGFNSVRQALLQTNRLIKDIDEILEKKD